MFKASGLGEISYWTRRNKPTITKDYTTYEIWSIFYDSDDDTITLSTIPVDPWMGKVEDITLDDSIRSNTLDKVKRLVEKYFGWNWA